MMGNFIIIIPVLLLQYLYFAESSSPQNCGTVSSKSRVDNKIVGGNTSNVEFHPWFAALALQEGSQYVVACGATLITPTHLITAAHCYDGVSNEPREKRFSVLFNLQNRCEENKKPAQVKKVILHNDYGKGSHLPENDIAMIVLSKPTSNTPICLPSKSKYDGDDGLIIGYGSTKVRSSQTYPCQLREAKINVFSKQQCERSGIGKNLAQKTICAGVMKGGIDACDGDSGGPLMVQLNGKYELIGVTSYGIGCGRVNHPGVYTDLTDKGQAKWIQKKLSETSSSSGSAEVSENQPSLPSGGSYQRPPKLPKPPKFPFTILGGSSMLLPPHMLALMNAGFFDPQPHQISNPHFLNMMDIMEPFEGNFFF